MLKEVFDGLNYLNKVPFFEDGEAAPDFLNGLGSDIIPLIILSDINTPKLNGFQQRVKVKMDASLQLRCVEYIFFSAGISQKAVVDPCSASLQGFFIKQNSMKELEKSISVIIEYWKRCVSPNNFLSQDSSKNIQPADCDVLEMMLRLGSRIIYSSMRNTSRRIFPAL